MKQSKKNKQSVKYLVEDDYEVLTTDVMTLIKNKEGDFRIVDANGKSWKAQRFDVMDRTGEEQ